VSEFVQVGILASEFVLATTPALKFVLGLPMLLHVYAISRRASGGHALGPGRGADVCGRAGRLSHIPIE
jgi:hypothetical protein